MFESQSKSQPKLVYTYVGNNHSNRDQEDIPQSANKTSIKDSVKTQETLTQKSQQNEAKIPTFQNLLSQLQQKDPQHAKKEVNRRDVQTNEQIRQHVGVFVPNREENRHFKETNENQKQPDIMAGNQQIKHESERREIHQLEQQRQPKQIDISYMSTRKVSIVNTTSAKNENILSSSMKQLGVVDNEDERKEPIILNNSVIARRENTTIETHRDQESEVRGREKLTEFEKAEHSLKPAAEINPESISKMIISSSSSEYQVSSMRMKTTNNETILNSSGSVGTENYVPKQENVNSSILTNNQQIQQQNIHNQQEQKGILQLQRQQQVPGELIKEAENTKLHVTAIKVQNSPLERKQTWPLLPQPDYFEQAPKTSNITTIISQQMNSQILRSSTKVSEQISKSEINQDPIHFATYQAPPLTNPPKSILKNSISFDQTDTSHNSLTFSEPDRENIPRFDFKSLLTGSKDTVSRTKESSKMSKRQNQSHFMNKISSPPPQRKDRKHSEDSNSKDAFHKDGLVPKKSVTFDSQVLLHLDDQMSAIEPLPVDA